MSPIVPNNSGLRAIQEVDSIVHVTDNQVVSGSKIFVIDWSSISSIYNNEEDYSQLFMPKLWKTVESLFNKNFTSNHKNNNFKSILDNAIEEVL